MVSPKSRRRFLAASGGLFAGTALRGLWPLVSGLGSMSSFANANSSDYRALVCIYLYGGNDAYNMLVPSNTSAYQDYADLRTTLAVEQSRLLPVTPLTSNGVDYGFHPDLSELSDLFTQGKLAMVANTGSLIVPTSPQQFADRSVPLPFHLSSHNSQTDQWQRLRTDGVTSTGWAGRIADYMSAANSAATLPMNISFNGSRLLQTGNTTRPYPLGPNGPVSIQGINRSYTNSESVARVHAYDQTLQLSPAHPMAQEFGNLSSRTGVLLDNLQSAWPSTVFTTPTPTDVFQPFTTALSNVAKMLSASTTLGISRQIFMVGLGGFDTHGNQIARQASLFRSLSGGMNYLYKLTEELGIADKVTTFTMSEFGRTLTSNGDGSDHGWGGHQLVMGGAVQGGDIYGEMPEIVAGNPLMHNSRGTFIPTTSVEQYAATLASWYGVPSQNLNDIFPNLANFDQSNLGFMG